MAYLFGTDAISELLRPHLLPAYVSWLATIAREEQYTSTVVIGELYKGAYRSQAKRSHLDNIESRILPAVISLSCDVAKAILISCTNR
jgi:predicted nucleic acid-binding protein